MAKHLEIHDVVAPQSTRAYVEMGFLLGKEMRTEIKK